MKILKVPDEFDMDMYNSDKKRPSISCPYCGNKDNNKEFIKYEFNPKWDGSTSWKHDFRFTTRVREVGLYQTLFRRYHIMYNCMKCDSCGAEWCGDLVDDHNAPHKYLEKDRDKRCSDHSDHILATSNIISCIFLVLGAIIFMVAFL